MKAVKDYIYIRISFKVKIEVEKLLYMKIHRLCRRFLRLLELRLGDEILRQLHPQTADRWGLTIWEKRLKLVTNLNEDIEKRRRKVITNIQAKGIMEIGISQSFGAEIIETYPKS